MRKSQDAVAAVARYNLSLVLRIQCMQRFQVDVAQVGYLLEMQLAVDVYGICRQGQLRVHRADVMVTVIVHDVVGCNEGRHISSCLFRQVVVDAPVVPGAIGTVNGFVDSTRTAVVGSNDQVPVLESLVKVVQVTCGSIRSLDGVAAFVDEAVGLKSVNLSRTQHELPESGRSLPGYGGRVECRLDDGQVFQLIGEVVQVECLFEDRHIEIGGSQHVRHRFAQASAVHVDELAHNVVVGHFHDGRYAGQAVDIDGIRIGRVHIFVVAVFGRD
ncbi:unknown [Bacteroides sp. CAG:462]|nr:unknown [Bacteroides sp. CAG:462]